MPDTSSDSTTTNADIGFISLYEKLTPNRGARNFVNSVSSLSVLCVNRFLVQSTQCPDTKFTEARFCRFTPVMPKYRFY